MIICGLKITHDSTIALLRDNKLIFSIELEKINNNNRYKILPDLSAVSEILGKYGFKISDIDEFVLDGWIDNGGGIPAASNGKDVVVRAAPYHENGKHANPLTPFYFNNLILNGSTVKYTSYMHVTGHIFSAYCTSPFSKVGEDAFILVWDGGMYPRLYHYSCRERKLTFIDNLFFIGVNAYSIFCQHFGPFKINENIIKDELSIAGKIMAFTALGKVRQEIVHEIKLAYEETITCASSISSIPQYPYKLAKQFVRRVVNSNFYDEDVIASFHYFLEELLVNSLYRVIRRTGYRTQNLCLVGGAALNIKWNGKIRDSGIVRNVWTCPFPNDSGSAIGAACTSMINNLDYQSLEWSVYSGPAIIENVADEGWTSQQFSLKELAQLLHKTNEPVVFLNDRAELGPRALGNRSILASPSFLKTKHILNDIKYRESYRPVAPVCLEEFAAEIFSPGNPDPYMLYDHRVNPVWENRLRAIVHEDGTARLQTVSEKTNKELYSLLAEFYLLSGIPVLCNTSANFKGCGFFPDIFSATRWGKVNYVWCNGKLYTKISKVSFI